MHLRLMLTALAAAVAGTAAARPRATPSLEGTWDLGSYTELERPKGVAGLVMTPAEAEVYEAPRRAMGGMLPSKPGDGVGHAESEFIERGSGLARVNGQIRSSWIVDPPDGKIPYRPQAMTLAGPGGPGVQGPPGSGLDNPEEMGGATRCLANVSAGAPILAAPDSNVVQMVQTKDHLAIETEKYHDVRIVRLFPDAKTAAAAPRDPPAWLGSSVGWWEAATLVVVTDGFHPGVINKGQRVLTSGATRVTERFTRTSPGELFYQFTVEDALLLTRPWRGEMALHPAKGRIYEYACHEGNYGLGNILAGARVEERAVKAAKSAEPPK